MLQFPRLLASISTRCRFNTVRMGVTTNPYTSLLVVSTLHVILKRNFIQLDPCLLYLQLLCKKSLFWWRVTLLLDDRRSLHPLPDTKNNFLLPRFHVHILLLRSSSSSPLEIRHYLVSYDGNLILSAKVLFINNHHFHYSYFFRSFFSCMWSYYLLISKEKWSVCHWKKSLNHSLISVTAQSHDRCLSTHLSDIRGRSDGVQTVITKDAPGVFVSEEIQTCLCCIQTKKLQDFQIHVIPEHPSVRPLCSASRSCARKWYNRTCLCIWACRPCGPVRTCLTKSILKPCSMRCPMLTIHRFTFVACNFTEAICPPSSRKRTRLRPWVGISLPSALRTVPVSNLGRRGVIGESGLHMWSYAPLSKGIFTSDS